MFCGAGIAHVDDPAKKIRLERSLSRGEEEDRFDQGGAAGAQVSDIDLGLDAEVDVGVAVDAFNSRGYLQDL